MDYWFKFLYTLLSIHTKFCSDHFLKECQDIIFTYDTFIKHINYFKDYSCHSWVSLSSIAIGLLLLLVFCSSLLLFLKRLKQQEEIERIRYEYIKSTPTYTFWVVHSYITLKNIEWYGYKILMSWDIQWSLTIMQKHFRSAGRVIYKLGWIGLDNFD